ncbi:MAG TPA: ABC transporter permease [Microthrixaceae bacterium]|nr:ABC transporter permease [Microthrixaceae bacterium]HNI36135.1 ABC transporter permease [Microthrixaceae bacterium]
MSGRRKQARIRALLSTPTGVVGLLLLVGLVVVAIVGPSTWGDKATASDYLNLFAPRSADHPLGTDGAGRDLLARTLVGTRLSLLLATGSVLIAAVVGIAIGAAVAAAGGRVQRFGSTVIDTWLGFPSILLSVLVVTVLERGAGAATVAIGLSFAPFFARLTLTSAAAVAGRDFVAAGRLLGLSRLRIIRRYILGNIADSLVVAVFSTFGQCLVAVSALSFLGLGVQPEVGAQERYTIDWGVLLDQGVKNFRDAPAGALGPAFAIAVAGLAFGWFGDGLARIFNPRLTVRRKAGDS